MRDWRSGSIRERRPGVWEIRISVATDPITGRALQRSFTYRGTLAEAETRCAELATEYAARRGIVQAAPFLTIGGLLDAWINADHDWAPSTWLGYRSNAHALQRDRISDVRASRLTGAMVRERIGEWRDANVTQSVLASRFRVLRAALSWSVEFGLVDRNPLLGMRGPPQPEPRLAAPVGDVRRLITHAEDHVAKARANLTDTLRSHQRLLRAEQVLLLTRLAADTGARRGELASLKVGDLSGRVLHIRRGTSAEKIWSTKTHQQRRLTIGTTTAHLWVDLISDWEKRSGRPITQRDWLFRSDLDQNTRMSTSYLAHQFAKTRTAAGLPDLVLHQFRHTVATFLVGRGEILKAQQRLGHRDASTTLRNYAHALPLEDQDVADAIDDLLAGDDDRR